MAARQTGELDVTGRQPLLLIVLGAHLRAELADRPLGYRLRDRIVQWQQDTLGPASRTPAGAAASVDEPLLAAVCTDLWYLNAPDLMARPTICLGRPELNAASAYWANRLPTAFVIDDTLRIHLDPEFINLQACVWGRSDGGTASGVDLFEKRYLEPFLRTAHGLPTEEGTEG